VKPHLLSKGLLLYGVAAPLETRDLGAEVVVTLVYSLLWRDATAGHRTGVRCPSSKVARWHLRLPGRAPARRRGRLRYVVLRCGSGHIGGNRGIFCGGVRGEEKYLRSSNEHVGMRHAS
jgi:hypothetical protein